MEEGRKEGKEGKGSRTDKTVVGKCDIPQLVVSGEISYVRVKEL